MKLSTLDRHAIDIHLEPLPEGRSNQMIVGNTRNGSDYINYYDTRIHYPYAFDYLKDMSSGTVWMSASPQEIRDHLPYIDKFKTGNTLAMSGLGIGLVLRLLDYYGKVPSKVIVVERNSDVINLVWPYVKKDGYQVINSDIAEWLEGPGLEEDKYDLVVLDTWPSGDYLYLPWVERLKAGAKKIQKPRGQTFLWRYKQMVSNLREGLNSFIDLVMSNRVHWQDRAEGFKHNWPYFYPYMDWLNTTWSAGGIMSPTAFRRMAQHRVEEEIEAFKLGKYEGLHFTT